MRIPNELKDKRLLAFLTSNLVNTCLRFLYFIILTFAISTEDIGRYSALIYSASLIISLSSMGAYNLVMLDKKETGAFKNVLTYFYQSACLAAIILLIFPSAIFKFLFDDNVSYFLLVIIVAAELFSTYFSSLFKAATLSEYNDLIKKDAKLSVLQSACLVIGVTIFWQASGSKLNYWAGLYFSICALCFVYRLIYFRSHLKFDNRISFISITNHIRNGSWFMFSGFLRNTLLSVDKILVLPFLGAEVAGQYAIAQRFYNAYLIILNSVSGVKEGILYQLQVKSPTFLKSITSINVSTFTAWLMLLPIYVLTYPVILIIYSYNEAQIFLALGLILPIQLFSYTYLNGLNAGDFRYERILILVSSIVFYMTIIYKFSYVGYQVFVMGSFLVFAFIGILGRLVIAKRAGEDD